MRIVLLFKEILFRFFGEKLEIFLLLVYILIVSVSERRGIDVRKARYRAKK